MLTLLLLSLAGCAKHQLYRDDPTLCLSAEPEQSCPRHALQQVSFDAGDETSYLLGFIEFDDQGQRFSRDQMWAVQRDANITAVGHFAPYRTHTLRAEPLAQSVRATLQRFRAVSAAWDSDRPGGRIPFDGSVLERGADSVSKSPYLLIAVDEELIGDHNDLEDPRIFAFVRQLILLSSQQSDPAVRRQLRELLSE